VNLPPKGLQPIRCCCVCLPWRKKGHPTTSVRPEDLAGIQIDGGRNIPGCGTDLQLSADIGMQLSADVNMQPSADVEGFSSRTLCITVWWQEGSALPVKELL
jgi:hypothetical protein